MLYFNKDPHCLADTPFNIQGDEIAVFILRDTRQRMFYL